MGIINNPSMQCPYAAIVSVNLGQGADAESAIFWGWLEVSEMSYYEY